LIKLKKLIFYIPTYVYLALFHTSGFSTYRKKFLRVEINSEVLSMDKYFIFSINKTFFMVKSLSNTCNLII